MNFTDRVAQDPATAMVSCIIWIPIAIWVVSLIQWMVVGEIEGLYGAIGLFAIIGLGILAVSPPVKGLSLWIFFGVSASIVVYPILKTIMNRSSLAAIDSEQIDRYYSELLIRPDNVGAQVKLAELFFIRGLPADAIALGEEALKSMPQNLFRSEHQMVSAWKMQTVGADLLRTFACLRCHQKSPAGKIHCVHCGYQSNVELAKGRWSSDSVVGKFLAAWISILILIVGVPTASKLVQGHLLLGICLLVAEIAACVLVIHRAFLRKESR